MKRTRQKAGHGREREGGREKEREVDEDVVVNMILQNIIFQSQSSTPDNLTLV